MIFSFYYDHDYNQTYQKYKDSYTDSHIGYLKRWYPIFLSCNSLAKISPSWTQWQLNAVNSANSYTKWLHTVRQRYSPCSTTHNLSATETEMLPQAIVRWQQINKWHSDKTDWANIYSCWSTPNRTLFFVTVICVHCRWLPLARRAKKFVKLDHFWVQLIHVVDWPQTDQWTHIFLRSYCEWPSEKRLRNEYGHEFVERRSIHLNYVNCLAYSSWFLFYSANNYIHEGTYLA